MKHHFTSMTINMQSSLKLQQQQQQSVPKDERNQARNLAQASLSFDPMIPSDTTLAEVLGLVEVLGERGSNIPISVSGSRRFFRGSSEFLVLLAATKMLGLVSMADNRFFLTEIGLAFLKANFHEQMETLKARLTRIEPFKSTLELLSDRKSIDAAVVSRRLSEKYAMGDFDPNRISLVLIDWGLPTCLLEYSSDDEFRLD